jgi:hypothetical protein
MSLENRKVKKDFYYSVKPSDNCDVEIQSIKFNKANIKLNSKADNVRSEKDQKPEGRAE